MLTRTNPNPNPSLNPNPNPNPPNPNQGWTLGTCMEYASSSNSTLLSPSIDFVKPLVSEYLTADQSYVNGVFDTYFVPSAASGELPSLYFTMAMRTMVMVVLTIAGTLPSLCLLRRCLLRLPYADYCPRRRHPACNLCVCSLACNSLCPRYAPVASLHPARRRVVHGLRAAQRGGLRRPLARTRRVASPGA